MASALLQASLQVRYWSTPPGVTAAADTRSEASPAVLVSSAWAQPVQLLVCTRRSAQTFSFV